MVEKSPSFAIRYHDVVPASISGRELIQILSAFNNISVKASRTFYGSDIQATFKISHVQPGSIDIQGFVEVAALAQSVFPALPSLALGISDIPELIKSWLDILKFLQGKPPTTVQNVSKGNAVQIQNSSGDTQVVNGNVYNTFIFNDIGRDASKFEAPIKRGAKQFDLMKGKRRIGSYSPSDLAQFRPIKPAASPIESEIDAILEVIAPVLEGEGVWRVKYGRSGMTAKLTDDEYRQDVVSGRESFRHGDRLKVRLKTIQENIGDKVSTKHFITKVIGRI